MNLADQNVREVKNAPEIRLVSEINVAILVLVFAVKMLSVTL